MVAGTYLAQELITVVAQVVLLAAVGLCSREAVQVLKTSVRNPGVIERLLIDSEYHLTRTAWDQFFYFFFFFTLAPLGVRLLGCVGTDLVWLGWVGLVWLV